MSTITKEWLQQTIAEYEANRDELPFGLDTNSAIELQAFKLALASLEAEKKILYRERNPYNGMTTGWQELAEDEYEFIKDNAGENAEFRTVYTAPPAPVADLLLSELLGIAKRAADEADECAHAEFSDDSMEYSAAIADWERRAAMLQGAEPVTTTNQLDFGENCWSCGKYFTYEQHSECDGYCPHCGSPVDLDDEDDKPSKVVPTQPTEEMVSRAWREATGKCDHETIKRIYATMVAAAPQQEVK
ncbi:hypothetical protein [Enterobacter ludwigii]|uniref:hypothetical protein n=1 Tax=Enterobacter ludwigii TaxID=299767 RepID=UPI002A7FD664|nr:hypothetical protein [Enterobacter ludwigii]